MRKFFYLFIALSSFIFTTSYAQVEKGKFILGGLINPNFTKNNYGGMDDNTWRINTQVRAGYFLTERFNLGIDLGNDFVSYKRDNGGSKSISIMAGPFMRYYFVNEKLGLFGEAGTGLGISSTKNNYDGMSDDKWTSNAAYVKFGPGLNYFIKENIALEVLMTYQRHWREFQSTNVYAVDQKTKVHVLDFKIGLLFLL
ncbi:MAG TPA: transporter [Cytophagaceae bacterium]|jgi:outer membrane protein